MLQTILLLTILIRFNVSLETECNEKCLLSKLKFPILSSDINNHKDIVLPSYDMTNNKFCDNALIWTNPSDYFSLSFMQKITNLPNPTNDIFREKLYQKYLSHHNKLLLSIKSNTNNEQLLSLNHSNIQKLIDIYHFDGIQYKTIQNRELLSGNYSAYDDDGKELEFDIMNQRTYDAYDWFICAFIQMTFGCCCMCFGGICTKHYMKGQMVKEDDIESVETPQVTTPISALSDYTPNKYTFAGFNIFGGSTPVLTKKNRNTLRNSNNCSNLTDHASVSTYSEQEMKTIADEVISGTEQQIQAIARPPAISLPNNVSMIEPKYKDRDSITSTLGMETPKPTELSQTHVSVAIDVYTVNGASSSNIIVKQMDENTQIVYENNMEDPMFNLDIIAEDEKQKSPLHVAKKDDKREDNNEDNMEVVVTD